MGSVCTDRLQSEGRIRNKGNKGSTTYTLKKKLKMAIETITSFSSRPLYLIFVFGIFIILAAFLNIAVIIYNKILYGVAVEGWASLRTPLSGWWEA